MKLLLLTLILSTLNFGCVGTVAESGNPYTESNVANDIPLNFFGIHMAQAISDTRVELFFYPATGGSGKYTYDVQVGNEVTPRSYSSDTLTPDYQGRLKVTIKNLDRLSPYQFKIEVRDEGRAQQSNSGVVKNVVTFQNEVAKFDGIQSISNLPGQDGKDSLRIRWNPADIDTGLVPKDWEPASYEIVVLDSLKFLPSDFDVIAGPAQGRWVYNISHHDDLLETVIQGLPSKTKFYIRMRALHLKSIDSQFDPKLRSEQNSNYITISTLSGSLSDLIYDPNQFALSLTPGMQGLNSVNASWQQAQGVFDHFRLYYWKKNPLSPTPTLPDNCLNPSLAPPTTTVFCKKVNYNLSLTAITGLEAYTEYSVALVLCATSSCSSSGDRMISPIRSIITDPSTASFTGINEVVPATKLSEIGSVTISYNFPNFTNGYFDGLILKVRRSDDDSTASEEVLESGEATSELYHLPYDIFTDNKITVKGLDYLAAEPYCFTLYSYKWNNDYTQKIEFPNEIWKCPNLTITGPTDSEFPGLESATTYGDTITFNWKTPLKGIFSHYELYWTHTNIIFNWGDAIAQVTNNNLANYDRKIMQATANAPNELNSVTLNLFATGTFKFGMITHYKYITPSGSFELRSETNANVLTCNVNNTPPLQQLDCI